MSKNNNSILIIVIIAIIALIAWAVTSVIPLITGNKGLVDTNQKFNYAMIAMPDGSVVEGEVETWFDYEGEQIQVIIDGNVYLSSAENIVLVCKK